MSKICFICSLCLGECPYRNKNSELGKRVAPFLKTSKVDFDPESIIISVLLYMFDILKISLTNLFWSQNIMILSSSMKESSYSKMDKYVEPLKLINDLGL